MKGMFIILIGPSGSGKNTLLKHVRETFPEIHFSPSYSSRSEMRPGESQGDPYYFVSTEEFEEMIEDGDFLEWAEYSGNYYGTARENVIPYLEKGEYVIKEMEIQGVRSVRSKLSSDNLHTIFIDAGDWGDLKNRITRRADMNPEDLEKRHERFKKEMEFRLEADTVIENKDGKLEEAKQSIEEVIRDILKS